MHPCPSSESSPGRLGVRCTRVSVTRGKSGPALGGTEYRIPADAINLPADSASEIVKFTISIPREWCTNAKAKYSSSVVPRCHLILRSTFTTECDQMVNRTLTCPESILDNAINQLARHAGLGVRGRCLGQML